MAMPDKSAEHDVSPVGPNALPTRSKFDNIEPAAVGSYGNFRVNSCKLSTATIGGADDIFQRRIQAIHAEAANNQIPKDSIFAWIRCFAAFFIQLFIVGFLHAFGVFFVALIDDFKSPKSTVAWVCSSCYGLTMALGPVASASVNRFGVRYTIVVGSVLCFISLIISSFVPKLEWLFLTFTVIYGLGMSLAYSPTMTIADDYFIQHLSVATGITVSGSSIGTLVLSPLSQVIVDNYGWRIAMRILATGSGVSMLCAFAFNPKPPAYQTGAQRLKRTPVSRVVAEIHLWKNRVYVVWVLAMTCAMFGYYIPYVHLVSHAQTLGIPPKKGSILLMVMGGSSAIGRVMFGKIITYGVLDRVNMHQLSMVTTGVGCLLLPHIESFGWLVVYVTVIGIVDGCFVVMMPLLTMTLAGVENKILAWGYLVGVCSITFTLGPPIAGWIFDMTGSYTSAFQGAAGPILLGALILFLIPWAQRTSEVANDALSIVGDIDRDGVSLHSEMYHADGTSVLSAWAAPIRTTQSRSRLGSGVSLTRKRFPTPPIYDRRRGRQPNPARHFSSEYVLRGPLYVPRGNNTSPKREYATSLETYHRPIGTGRKCRSVSGSPDSKSIQWSDRVGKLNTATAGPSNSPARPAKAEVTDNFMGIFNETFKSTRPAPSSPKATPKRFGPMVESNPLLGMDPNEPKLGSPPASPRLTPLITIPENKQLRRLSDEPPPNPEPPLVNPETNETEPEKSSSNQSLNASQIMFPMDATE